MNYLDIESIVFLIGRLCYDFCYDINRGRKLLNGFIEKLLFLQMLRYENIENIKILLKSVRNCAKRCYKESPKYIYFTKNIHPLILLEMYIVNELRQRREKEELIIIDPIKLELYK